MRHSHTPHSSRRPRRLPCLEALEDRCVPTAGGLLGGGTLGSLVGPVVSTVQEPLTALVGPVAPGNPGATASTPSSSAAPSPNSQPGLVSGLLNVVAGPLDLLGLGSATAPAGSSAAGNQNGGLLATVVSLTVNTVSGVVHDLAGNGKGSNQGQGGDHGKGHSTVVETTFLVVEEILPIQVSLPSAGPAVTVQVGSGTGMIPLGDRVVFSVLSNPANTSPTTEASDPSTVAVGTFAYFLHNSQEIAPTSVNQTQPVNSLVLVPAPLSSSPALSPWANQLGAAEGSRSGDLWAEPLGLILPEQRAQLAQGEAGDAILESQPTELASLAPVSAGLLTAADDLGALDRAFQEFLNGLSELRQTLSGWLVRLGPTPWILMGLAVTVTLSEEFARRRRSASQGRDAETSMDGVPFSAFADA